MAYLNVFFKYFFLFGGTYFIFKKVLAKKNYKVIHVTILIFIISLIFTALMFSLYSIMALFVSLIIYAEILKIIYGLKFNSVIVILIFSYSLCYIIYILFGSIPVTIVNAILFDNYSPSFLECRLAEILYICSIFKILSIKKFKYGVSIFKNVGSFLYLKILMVLSGGSIIVIPVLLWKATYSMELNVLDLKTMLFFLFVILSVILFIWLKRELNNHYKTKANEQTIENLLAMVEEQKGEIERLLKVSKISHKTNHQIDILKKKLMDMESSEVLGELNKLSNKYHKDVDKVNKKTLLQVTNVSSVDEVLNYMYSEASENKIDFVVKINGSVNYMVKNIINEDKFCTILSDHLKNSIISINHSKNPFRSITINIGEIGDYYGVAIHDTGIEFKVSTLVNLGLKATTTHKKDGGTGIGFLTTFETLKEIKASLIINERKPEDYNYTKTITILFDEKAEYKINSYRKNLIKEKNVNNEIILTNKK